MEPIRDEAGEVIYCENDDCKRAAVTRRASEKRGKRIALCLTCARSYGQGYVAATLKCAARRPKQRLYLVVHESRGIVNQVWAFGTAQAAAQRARIISRQRKAKIETGDDSISMWFATLDSRKAAQEIGVGA